MGYIAHVSVTALPSQGASVGEWVRIAVREFRRSGLRHELHAMGTEVEYDRPAQLWRILDRIDKRLASAGAQRVMVQLKIDHRLDKPASLRSKVQSARRAPRAEG